MTILHPVRQRLSAARLYAVVVPAPFTPPDALVRRVEDLVSAGVDVVQLDLDGWEDHDALGVLNRCTPVVVPTGRLLVVAHAVDVALDLGADALLLDPAQELPAGVPERLGAQAAVGREVGDEVQVGAALESEQIDFLVLIGDRAVQVAARAHQLSPLDVPDAYEDQQAGSRPWFVDIGPQWPDPAALPEPACRIRFHVSVPADSPVADPSPQLRADVADLAARVAARWDRDEALVARREQAWARNSAASTSFAPTGADASQGASTTSDGAVGARTDPYDTEPYAGDPDVGASYAGDPYDSEAVRDYGHSGRAGEEADRAASHPIRDFLSRAFHLGQPRPRDERAPGAGNVGRPGAGSDGATDGGVGE